MWKYCVCDNFFFYSFTDFIIFFFPFSAIALPQLPKQTSFFFFLHFRQWHCYNCQNNFFFFCVFFFTFSAMAMRWLVDWIFVFLFTACTSIIFFFRIVIIYVLSLLFLVYRVYINYFFLLYCKNLCTLQYIHQLFLSFL